jgi:hypothetical protein
VVFAQQCTKCEAGLFSNATGLQKCLPCPRGFISAKVHPVGACLSVVCSSDCVSPAWRARAAINMLVAMRAIGVVLRSLCRAGVIRDGRASLIQSM